MEYKPEPFDFHGKTAPVRIYRTLNPREGRWSYHTDITYAISRARRNALEYSSPTDVRLLEVERTLNKEMLVAILDDDQTKIFWKNEYIVREYFFNEEGNLRHRELEGFYKKFVPTPDQVVDAERREREAKRNEERIRRAEEERAERARKKREEEEARKAHEEANSHRAHTESEQPYFHTEADFDVWWETHKNKPNPPNKFEKELRICKPYSKQEATLAYRKRVKETHPDVGGSTEAFLAVQAAYDGLMMINGWR